MSASHAAAVEKHKSPRSRKQFPHAPRVQESGIRNTAITEKQQQQQQQQQKQQNTAISTQHENIFV